MKKVLVAMLVCGLGAVSYGGLFFTINGKDADTTDWGPLDTPFELGVDSDGQVVGFTMEIRALMGATLDSSRIAFPVTWMFPPNVRSSSDVHVDVTGGDFFAKTGPLTVLNGVMADRGSKPEPILINLVATGAVNLGDEGTMQAGTVIDSIYVPEPASLMLLGLGGLLLRRLR